MSLWLVCCTLLFFQPVAKGKSRLDSFERWWIQVQAWLKTHGCFLFSSLASTPYGARIAFSIAWNN
jgi:hypothetical protein